MVGEKNELSLFLSAGARTTFRLHVLQTLPYVFVCGRYVCVQSSTARCSTFHATPVRSFIQTVVTMSDEETRWEFPSPRVRRVLNPHLYEAGAAASPVQRRVRPAFVTPETRAPHATPASPPAAPMRARTRLRRILSEEEIRQGMKSPVSYKSAPSDASSTDALPRAKLHTYAESEASSTSAEEEDALSTGSPVDEIARAYADSYDAVRDALQQIHASFTALESYEEHDQGLFVGSTMLPLVEVLRGLMESYTDLAERDRALAMARDAVLRKRARTSYTEHKELESSEEESSAYETSEVEDDDDV